MLPEKFTSLKRMIAHQETEDEASAHMRFAAKWAELHNRGQEIFRVADTKEDYTIADLLAAGDMVAFETRFADRNPRQRRSLVILNKIHVPLRSKEIPGQFDPGLITRNVHS